MNSADPAMRDTTSNPTPSRGRGINLYLSPSRRMKFPSEIKVKCAFCGKNFFRKKGRFNEAEKFSWKQYCSWGCLSRDKLKRQVLSCENCGKYLERPPGEVSPHNYCSRSCTAIVNNKKYPKTKAILKTCAECGKKYKKSTNNIKYCSFSCRRKATQRTPEELKKIIREAAKKLKRAPARREIDGIHDSCRKVFGSWNNAVVAAGLQPNRSHSQRMYKRTNTVASDGHLCDSVSEALIDNWFTKNNIFHEKDIPYPKTNYKADWSIFVKQERVFVEYFGLANDSPRYDRTIKEKRSLCRKCGLKLIVILPQDLYPKRFSDENLKSKFKDFLTA